MNNVHGLAQELLAIESETFEIEDFQGADELRSSCSCCSSTCSTTSIIV
jgi:hypothetical protein